MTAHHTIQPELITHVFRYKQEQLNNNNNNNNIIKNKKRENTHTDRCGNTRRQKCCAKESGKEVKI